MPNFFLNVLPDPDYTITTGGFGWDDVPGGEAGPGIASVTLSEKKDISRDRTIGGRLIYRSRQTGTWSIKITYNPMTRTQFLPIYNFLMQQRGSRTPFYVSLPQYKLPMDGTFATYTAANPGSIANSAPVKVGATSMEIFGPAAWATLDYHLTGLPSPGDLFTINSTTNTLASKAYLITHVETEKFYKDALVSGDIRIHFTPGLQVSLADFAIATIDFVSPLIKVTQVQDIQEYSLDNSNLYTFSLNLEEILY